MNGNESNGKIGVIIGQLREANSETQQALADSLGVKRETVNQWENGTRQIKASAIIGIAEHFNVSSDYLLGLTDEPTTNPDMRAMCEYTGLSEDSLLDIRVTSCLCAENCTGKHSPLINDFVSAFWHDLNYSLIELWNTTEKVKSFLKELSPDENIEAIERIKQELELSIFRVSKVCNDIPDIFLSDILLSQLEHVYSEKYRSRLILNPVEEAQNGEHTKDNR